MRLEDALSVAAKDQHQRGKEKVNSVVKFEDKFLDRLTFYRIRKVIFDQIETPWTCIKDISGEGKEKDCYFTHMLFETRVNEDNRLYDTGQPCSPHYWIADILKEAIGAEHLIRVKANLYTRTDTLVSHTPHTDYRFPHKAALLSLNTCDGHTNVNGTKVSSVKNRMLFFDPQVIHNSTNCTDEQFRCNININYM